MSMHLRWLGVALLCALHAPGAPAFEKEKAPPRTDPLLEPFMQPASFVSMRLSPDGRHIAAIGYSGTNSGVIMIDSDTLETNVAVPAREHKREGYMPYVRDPRSVHWLRDDLFAVNFTYNDAAAYKIDGTPYGDLMQGFLGPLRSAPGATSDWELLIRRSKGLQFARYNIETRQDADYDIDVSGKILRWIRDSVGTIRVVQSLDTAFFTDTSRVFTWYRSDEKARWLKIDDRSVNDDSFDPLFAPYGSDRLVVLARNGRDRDAVWEFDVARRTFGELIAEHDTDDIAAVRSDERSAEVRSITTDGLKPKTFWLDERMAALQASVDAILTDHVNVLQEPGSSRVLIYSYSDVDPGAWYLLDTGTHKMKLVSRRIPAIDPKRMQPMYTLHYPVPDGLSIPAYLTMPGARQDPVPMIVLIHGGPWARDRWDWNDEVQAFAAHGYAVFQPQFRGSTGFGKRFEEAGFGQWGQAMQDDITAGVQFMIDQKFADPKRICIVGTSYGGYAALWGLAKTPDLYKCGVSTAGVSDIERMLTDDSDSNDDAVAREMMLRRVGDARKMRVSWDSVSPLKHADRIKAPLLLVHGDRDVCVPIKHGRDMLKAMQALHKDVQWLEFEDEGHGVSYIANQRAWYAAMFALFERTIGKGEPPFPPPALADTTVTVPDAPATRADLSGLRGKALAPAASAPAAAPAASGVAP